MHGKARIVSFRNSARKNVRKEVNRLAALPAEQLKEIEQLKSKIARLRWRLGWKRCANGHAWEEKARYLKERRDAEREEIVHFRAQLRVKDIDRGNEDREKRCAELEGQIERLRGLLAGGRNGGRDGDRGVQDTNLENRLLSMANAMREMIGGFDNLGPELRTADEQGKPSERADEGKQE